MHMILKGMIMIQSSEAIKLEALIYAVLDKYFANPVSGATTR